MLNQCEEPTPVWLTKEVIIGIAIAVVVLVIVLIVGGVLVKVYIFDKKPPPASTAEQTQLAVKS